MKLVIERHTSFIPICPEMFSECVCSLVELQINLLRNE